MDLTFDRGDYQRPRGHALVYFRVDTEEQLYASYVVALPVKSDFGKYVPPFLAGHLGNAPIDLSKISLPPVPEPVSSYAELERLSQLRDDDLVFASSMFSFDLLRMMEAITEAVEAYAQLYTDYVDRLGLPGGSAPAAAAVGPGETAAAESEADDSYSVNEVLFGLMSERDKLTELSRLLGKLQFAQEGRDETMAGEAAEEIKALARHLPAEFQVLNLLAAAAEATAQGSRLAQLYLDRCFRLSDGDAGSARELDAAIAELRGEG